MVSGADRDGDALVMCGTTLIVWVTVPEARHVPGLWTIPHTTAGKSLIGGASNAGGLFLGWVDRVIAPGTPGALDPHRVPVWSPYIRGERTPSTTRTGGPSSTRSTHPRRHRAAQGRLRSLRFRGPSAHRTQRCAGLAHRGHRWRHPPGAMDAGHRRCHRPAGDGIRVPEGAALGAAFLGRMAAGLETSIIDAGRWACTDRVVDPDPAWVGSVEGRYRRFLALGEQSCRPPP